MFWFYVFKQRLFDICVSQYRANVFTAKVWLVRRSLKFDEMFLSIQDDLHRVSIFVQVDQTVHLLHKIAYTYASLCILPPLRNIRVPYGALHTSSALNHGFSDVPTILMESFLPLISYSLDLLNH